MGIYTDVILPHMDSYEAFIYIRRNAPTDFKYPATYTGNDMKYAKRLISEGFRSAEALEGGSSILHVRFVTGIPKRVRCIIAIFLNIIQIQKRRYTI